jgi:hypothetical protein
MSFFSVDLYSLPNPQTHRVDHPRSPREREELSRSPMRKAILSYKAITEGAINALKDSWTEHHPTDPERMIIHTVVMNPVDLGF